MNKYEKVLSQYEPTNVTVKISDGTVLLDNGTKGHFKLTSQSEIKELDRTIKSMYQHVSTEDTDTSMRYDFDWTLKKPIFEDNVGDVVDLEAVPIKKDTILPTLEESLNYLTREVVTNKLFSVTITSNRVLIHDSVVQPSLTERNYAETIFMHYNPESESIKEDSDITVEVGSDRFNLSLNIFGKEMTVNASRLISADKPYSMGISGDMLNRINIMGNGILGCSIHPNIGLDYMINMLTKVEKHVERLSCSVGDVFKIYGKQIPNTRTSLNIKNIIGSHYKYVFIQSSVNHTLKDILDLVFNGKIVIMGYDSDSLYGNLINLLNEGIGSPSDSNKILTSTIGFIHPKISYKNDKISLEDSESVTINNSRVRALIEGDISRERFNTYIDYPCRVYSLTLTKGDATFSTQKEEFEALLKYASMHQITDLHLAVNSPIKARIHSILTEPFPDTKITVDIMRQLVSTIVTTELQQQELILRKQVTIGYGISGLGRFRIQIITQRGTFAIVIRRVPHEIPTPESLRIPQIIYDTVLRNPRGLVLVTGPVNTGKSTTATSILETLSKHKSYAITTLSEPIEYLISHGISIVTQRELPTDVESYDDAVNSIVRLDPDIIELTEVRDEKSISAMLRLGGAGHLVLSSFHSDSVIASVDGLANRMPVLRKVEMLSTLSNSIAVIVNQDLLQGVDGKIFPIFEYLIPNNLIRSHIEKGKISEIESLMKTSALSDKKVATWRDYEIIEAYLKNFISYEVMKSSLRDTKSLLLYSEAKAIEIPMPKTV